MPMRDDELQSVVSSFIDEATNYIEDDIGPQRAKALSYYNADPDAMPLPETEGKSKIVTHDVEDVIEWILPDLIKMFASGTKSVHVSPVGVEDEAQMSANEELAKQVGDYIGHKFWEENDGFLIMYQMFKDALIQKNGFSKTVWEESQETKRYEIENASLAQVAAIEAQPDLEIVESEEAELSDDFGPLQNITVVETEEDGDVRIDAIPPEEIIIVPGAKLTEVPDYMAHAREMTVSEFVDTGLGTKEEALELAGSGSDTELGDNIETRARNKNARSEEDEDTQPKDPSLRKLPVWEGYAKIDFDEDGIAELRQVTAAGSVKKIIVNEPVDDNPFSTITPIVMSHKFFGKSVAETLMDLMELHTNTSRQIIDNNVLINNQRFTGVEGRFNLDDYLTNRAGGVVRVKDHDALRPIPQQSLPPDAYQMIERIDQMKADRSGVDRTSQGLSADTLSTSGVAIDLLQSAKRQKVELIARVFAETGVRRQFELMLKLFIKHKPRARTVQLRGKWVQVDPRHWDAGMRVKIKVGLGTGSTTRRVGALDKISQNQSAVVQGGGMGTLVTPDDLYNTQVDLVDALDLDNPERYWSDPREAPPPQPEGPSEDEISAQTDAFKAQADAQKDQVDAQQNQQKIELERQQSLAKLQLDQEELDLKRRKLLHEINNDEQELDLKRAEIAAETALRMAQIEQGEDVSSRIEGSADTL